MSSLRRLPFNGPEGSPAFTPDTNPNGMLARLADQIETRQLETGQAVLTLSRQMLEDEDDLEPKQARFVIMRLAECLADALTVAEMRGERLPVPESQA
ncbi:hypothetical protein [Streptomyces sp. NBC_01262]|uniref:hypothetical protein n=1 Tax=Streptomyces sp. NBC_01262 TaxID=2903803 RepID=UPI002E31EC2B|nr:hypothetical protein [Streptomyces sp. NBC_01262]